MKRTLGLAALGLLFACTLVGCGDDGDNGSTDKADGNGGSATDDDAPELDDVVVIDGPEADVKVLDNSFNDENIEIAPGTKVVWTNDGRQDHDILPAEGDEWGVDPDGFAPDAVYEHTFDQPGTYRYYCSLHGTPVAGMVGAIVVKE